MLFAEADYDREKADPELVSKIKSAKAPEDLVDTIIYQDTLVGEENGAMLERALFLKLSSDDWAEIYEVAEPGSELERTALERSQDE